MSREPVPSATQSIYVETQALYDAAFAWRTTAAPKLSSARSRTAHGEDQGYLFGVLLNSLQEPHDTFASDAVEVLTDGWQTAKDMGEALEQVAKDYESTDSNTATLMTKEEAGL